MPFINGSARSISLPGVWIPGGWGTNSRTKIAAAKAGTGIFRIGVLGDSVSRGYLSSNLDTKSWPALVKAWAQAQWGNGGFGFKGATDSQLWMDTNYATTIEAFYAAANNVLTLTGTWTIAGSGIGPGGVQIYTTTSGATLTSPAIFDGTTVRVFYGSNNTGQFTVAIDGGTAVTVTPPGTGDVGVYEVTGLSAGPHSVVATTLSTTAVAICGIDSYNASGVVVNNFSTYGYTSAPFINNASPYYAGLWSGGKNNPQDLLIYALGLNDCHTNISPTTYIQNVEKYFNGVANTTAPGTTDFAVVIPAIGEFDPDVQWSNYVPLMRGWAESIGALVVDFTSLARFDWNYWQQLGYQGTDTLPFGGAGSDIVHLSDAGYANMASVIEGAIALGLQQAF